MVVAPFTVQFIKSSAKNFLAKNSNHMLETLRSIDVSIFASINQMAGQSLWFDKLSIFLAVYLFWFMVFWSMVYFLVKLFRRTQVSKQHLFVSALLLSMVLAYSINEVISLIHFTIIVNISIFFTNWI